MPVADQRRSSAVASVTPTYEHSGSMGLAIPLGILIGLPSTILLAAMYAYVVVYCPVIGYVNLVFLAAFIFGGAVVLNRIAQWGNCRSVVAMTGVGLMLGFAGLYFSWIFFIKALIGEQVSLVGLITSPGPCWQLIAAINAEGWWGPSGIAQWVLVSIEAIGIVAGFTLAGTAAIGERIFCERCSKWCIPFETMHLKKDPVQAASIESNAELLTLPETTDDDFPRYEAHVLQCESCRSMQAIRFYDVSQQMDDGELKVKREEMPGVLVQNN